MFDIDFNGGTSVHLLLSEPTETSVVREILDRKFGEIKEQYTLTGMSRAVGRTASKIYKVDSSLPEVEQLEKTIEEAFQNSDGKARLATYSLERGAMRRVEVAAPAAPAASPAPKAEGTAPAASPTPPPDNSGPAAGTAPAPATPATTPSTPSTEASRSPRLRRRPRLPRTQRPRQTRRRHLLRSGTGSGSKTRPRQYRRQPLHIASGELAGLRGRGSRSVGSERHASSRNGSCEPSSSHQ